MERRGGRFEFGETEDRDVADPRTERIGGKGREMWLTPKSRRPRRLELRERRFAFGEKEDRDVADPKTRASNCCLSRHGE